MHDTIQPLNCVVHKKKKHLHSYLVNWHIVCSFWIIGFFQKCKVSVLLLKRALSIQALKTNPYITKQDLYIFVFWVYKSVLLKKCFLYLNKNDNDYHHGKTKWTFLYTIRLNRIAHFAVDILLLHHYDSDLAHLSDLYSLVVGVYNYERLVKRN